MNLSVMCLFSESGCNWEGKYKQYQEHIDNCDYAVSICEYCDERIHKCELKTHNQSCPCMPKPCPLAGLGCTEEAMESTKLQQHMENESIHHLAMVTSRITTLEAKVQVSSTKERCLQLKHEQGLGLSSQQWNPDFVEADGAASRRYDSGLGQSLQLPYHSKTQFVARLQDTVTTERMGSSGNQVMTHSPLESVLEERMAEMKKELMTNLMAELRAKDEELAEEKTTIRKLEETVRSLSANIKDRDFRLSLIENSNHDGSMIWKIPQFSQRKADAQNGKYTSIFSLPYYSGRYGYKMCLRLYIMGDGIGKGTHLSLFFVVMRGEFDNILQWPFTHKVTFKLINQAGGRDIVDTFQPDPLSSSFRKPKSDMNIASGCPRFVSHTELERGGFIVDNTIFIKCTVDTSSIHQP